MITLDLALNATFISRSRSFDELGAAVDIPEDDVAESDANGDGHVTAQELVPPGRSLITVVLERR